MTVKFIYNKDVNSKCWKRYNDFIDENESVWGTIKEVKDIIKIENACFNMDITEIEEEYQKVFGIKVDVKGYIITTPFSMINDDGKIDDKGIIYYSIYTANPSVVIAHELFHIYFEKYTQRKIKNYDEAKEYFTVIINDIFKTDVSKGYPEHGEERKAVFDKWIETKSIDECIALYN